MRKPSTTRETSLEKEYNMMRRELYKKFFKVRGLYSHSSETFLVPSYDSHDHYHQRDIPLLFFNHKVKPSPSYIHNFHTEHLLQVYFHFQGQYRASIDNIHDILLRLFHPQKLLWKHGLFQQPIGFLLLWIYYVHI